MTKGIRTWGNGKLSKNIFAMQLWKFRLELWREMTSETADAK